MLMKPCFIGGLSLFATFAVMSSPRSALAQAGSIGGSIGKTDKSVSGGEEQTQKPNHSLGTKRKYCPNIVGFGKSDTTFNNDGTALHRSGITGKWWCDNGHIWLKLTTSDDHEIKLTAGGKKIIVVSDGHLVFSRE